jgi:hypothetical protein
MIPAQFGGGAACPHYSRSNKQCKYQWWRLDSMLPRSRYTAFEVVVVIFSGVRAPEPFMILRACRWYGVRTTPLHRDPTSTTAMVAS